ncbi:type II toxin-antitoxin system PemK/MazF family toxin [Haematospirillum jordaniae]|uniref:type II toxin-antitoxin system PemK/MazF family toxin n=1 Tax=Haematospirillum jordaniae TaxID=1549855 RepID=UPI001433211E|nr:type II toxin-antitoxin system PemK/MazF family toxin [Haematospirillum jordaniae]NKD86578.1 type II toxin-antitoxin system PemK/MazF family toxin [Haematospirillum jordaniae]
MRRGDLVTITLPGDFGKPRPALVIQSDQFIETATVSVLLLTGTLVDAPLIRMDIAPAPDNGLHKASQIMVDKVMTVRRDKVGEAFGRLDDKTMVSVNRALALFLGFG